MKEGPKLGTWSVVMSGIGIRPRSKFSSWKMPFKIHFSDTGWLWTSVTPRYWLPQTTIDPYQCHRPDLLGHKFIVLQIVPLKDREQLYCHVCVLPWADKNLKFNYSTDFSLIHWGKLTGMVAKVHIPGLLCLGSNLIQVKPQTHPRDFEPSWWRPGDAMNFRWFSCHFRKN